MSYEKIRQWTDDEIKEVGEDYASMYGHEMVGFKRCKTHIEVYTQGDGEGFVMELYDEDFERVR